MGKKNNVKKKTLYFNFSKEDTVIRFVIAIWSSRRTLVSFLQNILFLSAFTDPWAALPFSLDFPFFSITGIFMWHMQKLPSPWWCEEPRWGSPRGTVIHTTQEIPLDQSVNAIPPMCITPLISHPMWACGCIFLVFCFVFLREVCIVIFYK